jgi:hypothetical protein
MAFPAASTWYDTGMAETPGGGARRAAARTLVKSGWMVRLRWEGHARLSLELTFTG